MRAALFGLGEAGALYAEGLVAAGWTVVGYDPADTPTPSGVQRADTPAEAVDGCDAVFSLVGGKASVPVAQSVGQVLPAGTLFVDMNSSTTDIKQQVAEAVADAEVADVAVVGSVPAGRSATAVVISGPGSGRAAEVFRGLGAPVEDIAGEVGDAATRKLLRSSFMKGLGALIVEAVAAGEAAGAGEWVMGQIEGELADESAAQRLYDGTIHHAARRGTEAAQTARMLDSLGVPSTMSQAAATTHLRLADEARLPREEIAKAFDGLPVANIGDARDRLGMVDAGIHVMWRGARAVGFAKTVYTTAGDNKAIHEAIAEIKPGEFLVVNGQGSMSRALIGELMAQRAQKKGCVGIIIDGTLRDAGDLEECGFPAWARGVCPAGPYKNGPGKVNVPVAVGGVVFNPGDLVVADDDGVICIPVHEAAQALEAGRAVQEDEAGRRQKIREMVQL